MAGIPSFLTCFEGIYEVSSCRSGIYFLCDDVGVVYIGKTDTQGLKRALSHVEKEYTSIYFWPLDIGGGQLSLLENKLIAVYSPKYNKTNWANETNGVSCLDREMELFLRDVNVKLPYDKSTQSRVDEKIGEKKYEEGDLKNAFQKFRLLARAEGKHDIEILKTNIVTEIIRIFISARDSIHYGSFCADDEHCNRLATALLDDIEERRQ
jgi:hypothetical protein